MRPCSKLAAARSIAQPHGLPIYMELDYRALSKTGLSCIGQAHADRARMFESLANGRQRRANTWRICCSGSRTWLQPAVGDVAHARADDVGGDSKVSTPCTADDAAMRLDQLPKSRRPNPPPAPCCSTHGWLRYYVYR